MIRFAIVTTQRSGSTAFQYAINSLPHVSCHGEVFLGGTPHPDAFHSFCGGSAARRLAHLLFGRFDNPVSRRLIGQYLDSLFHNPGHAGPYLKYDEQHSYERRTGREEAVGFKLMYDQIRRYPALPALIRQLDVRVIHLVRRNTLKQVVSELIREQRGVAHSTTELAPVTLTVWPDDVKRRIDRIEGQRHAITGRLRGVPFMEVFYEEVFCDLRAAVRGVTDFLDLEPGEMTEPPLRKLTSDRLADVIGNYDELAAALAGTRYEQYLDE